MGRRRGAGSHDQLGLADDRRGWRVAPALAVEPGRIERALAAGGRLVSDSRAPAFWILADPEGNEACVCTWQGRDPVPGS